jgi:hypothetical protein
MKPLSYRFSILLGVLASTPALAAQAPANPAVKDLNTPRQFPRIESQAAWEMRAAEIREQVLISCGLWPMPEKAPLRATVFGKIERDGYSVEKVYLQTFPGFYLCGNLYRPLGKGKGPFPGVLNPHGHWSNGRMADEQDGSIAARCISQARLGMVAFCYDMVGYNDSYFPDHGVVPPAQTYTRHRRFATNNVNLLWNISLMGLQTWNSIRALDFLESLPEVDRKRLACTGESGGGTQTFMLGAVDRRLAAQAPIVMVSSTMQGGCLCENAPGLRVEYSNMEIAASVAPRPQFLVAATGDWTKLTPTVEGPAIESVYRLLNAGERFGYVRYDFGHNYNKTSREAVYGFLAKNLLGRQDSTPIPEPAYTKEPDAALFVWPDGKLPPDAKTETELELWLVAQYQAQLAALVPRTKAGLTTFQKVMMPAWRHTLQTPWPVAVPSSRAVPAEGIGGQEFVLESIAAGQELHLFCFTPQKRKSCVVIVATAEGSPKSPSPLSTGLLERGFTVLQVGLSTPPARVDQFAEFFCVYNRTALQERVQDLLRVGAFARKEVGAKKLVLCGEGTAGLYALLAAPAVDAVIADCNALSCDDDRALLSTDLFCPGLKRIGGFEGAALLAAPHPVLLHNAGSGFRSEMLRSGYKAVGAQKMFRSETVKLASREVLKWVRGVAD